VRLAQVVEVGVRQDQCAGVVHGVAQVKGSAGRDLWGVLVVTVSDGG
jgi:hypothetical protein